MNAEDCLSVTTGNIISVNTVERMAMPKNKKPVGIERYVWEEHRDKAVGIISAVADELGFLVVETDEIRKYDDILIKIVLWSNNGVGIADLTRISKRVLKRFENDHDLRTSGLSDVLRLDMSSPGIDRVLKNLDELNIFKGKDVIVYAQDNGAQISVNGINRGFTDNRLKLEVGDKIVEFEAENIERVRLAG